MKAQADSKLKNATEALELTLRSIIAARKARPARPLSPDAIDQMIWNAKDWSGPIPTREESAMERLASDENHREEVAIVALRWIGERLYKAGGVDLMRDTLETVAARNPSCEGRMLSIADSKWDGIGRTKTNPGWCS